MKGLLELLAKAKLVDLSEEEQLADSESASISVAEPAGHEPPPPSPAAAADLSGGDGKSLDAIFAEAGIPPSPFPAEKLLRLLDGLRAMDAATRKAAVLAMDAADDSWQIADCVIDAKRKVNALGGYKQSLAALLQEREQQAAADTAGIRTGLDTATAAIRQQIAELEQLLERKVTQSAQETTGIEADLRATREAIARESRRMDAEIERLSEISSQFTPAPDAN